MFLRTTSSLWRPCLLVYTLSEQLAMYHNISATARQYKQRIATGSFGHESSISPPCRRGWSIVSIAGPNGRAGGARVAKPNFYASTHGRANQLSLMYANWCIKLMS